MKSIEETKEEIAKDIRQALTDYVGKPVYAAEILKAFDEALDSRDDVKIIGKMITESEIVYTIEKEPLGFWRISWSKPQ